MTDLRFLRILGKRKRQRIEKTSPEMKIIFVLHKYTLFLCLNFCIKAHGDVIRENLEIPHDQIMRILRKYLL